MMSPFRLLLALCAILSVGRLHAQEPAENDRAAVEALAQRFMKEPSLPDWRELYTGEMRLFGGRPTPGAMYQDDKYEAVVRINEIDESSAALAVAMVEKASNQQVDFYLFLRKEDDAWKVAAVRSFAPPRGTGQMYAALAAKGKDVSKSDMRELGIMQVLQFHDSGMKQSFAERRKRFEEIAATISRRGVDEVIHGSTRSSRVDKALWQQVHDAGLNYVELQENGLIDFNAAAFGETAVGYFHVPSGVNPPPATPEDYVLVEPLDGPWYLYRRQ